MISTVYALLDFSLTVKAATLIFISGRGSAISSAKVGKSCSIYIPKDFRNAQPAKMLIYCQYGFFFNYVKIKLTSPFF